MLATLISIIGVAAGIGAYYLAFHLLGGRILPASLGFLAVIIADLIVFMLYYLKSADSGPEKE